jgi:hypothetical protein
MSATTTTPASGSKLLEAVKFDRHFCAAIIVSRPDSEQEELLNSIVAPNLRRNVAAAVAAIRQSLGLQSDYALGVSRGTE